jgi:hypothetical protein
MNIIGADGKDGTQIVPINGEDLDELAALQKLVVGTLYITTTDCYGAYVNAPAGTLYLATGADAIEEQVRLKGTSIYTVTGEELEHLVKTVACEPGCSYLVTKAFHGEYLDAKKGDVFKAIDESHLSHQMNITGDKYVLTEADKEEIAQLVPSADYTNLLHLPEKYNLVVGDTFELFYKGIMLCKNPYNYNILATCSIGKCWGRKFEVTPTVAGTHTLTITVSDDTGNVLDQQTTQLVVAEKGKSIRTNVLCVGDSLTSAGYWVGELNRRLTNTNSVAVDGSDAPTGDGLTNINFVGTCGPNNGAYYEGYGGWTFASYLNTSKSSKNYWVSCTHSKTDHDQESIYKDANNLLWQLETIEANRIKFKPYEGEGAMPSSGTLTWVSGGIDTSDITYTAITQEKGSPFVYDGEINLGAYCADLGIDTIHQCYILLGWNNTTTDADTYKAQAKQFIDLLLAFNPDMKIVLVGLQIPSLDGCGNDYGAKGTLANFRALQEYVFNLDNLYKEIADEYKNVESNNLSGQFDTDYNCITSELPVNNRNATTVITGTNGVHPSTQGYFQIADAAYRKFYDVYERADLLGLDNRTAVFRSVRIVTDTTVPREMALDKMYYFDSRAGYTAGSDYVFSITDLAATKDSLRYVANTTGTPNNFRTYGVSVPLGLEDGKTYTVSAKKTSYSAIYLQTYVKDGDMWTFSTSVDATHIGNNIYSKTFTAESGKGYALVFAVSATDAFGVLSEFTDISVVEAE